MAKTNFLKTLGKREILAPYLDAFFAANEWPEDLQFTFNPYKERDDHLHPSMHAMACPREIYAQQMGHLDEPSRQLLAQQGKMFMIGDFIHHLIQWVVVEGLEFSTWEDIEKEKLLRSEETPGGNRWTCRGFIDIANCHIPNVGNRLVDIKTVNSVSFATGIPPSLWAKYEAQVSLYLDWENHEEDAIVLLFEKDHPHRFKELYVQRNDALNEEVYERWDEATDAVATGTPPDCWCFDPLKCPVKNLYAQAARQ